MVLCTVNIEDTVHYRIKISLRVKTFVSTEPDKFNSNVVSPTVVNCKGRCQCSQNYQPVCA